MKVIGLVCTHLVHFMQRTQNNKTANIAILFTAKRVPGPTSVFGDSSVDVSALTLWGLVTYSAKCISPFQVQSNQTEVSTLRTRNNPDKGTV
jgi:hypothetical protein